MQCATCYVRLCVHCISGRLSTCRNDENLEKVRNAINADHRRIIDEISEITVFVLEFMSANVNGRFEYEKRFRKIRFPVVDRGSKKQSFECLLRVKGTSWKWPQIICKVVTGDETWCYGYGPEKNKHQANTKLPILQNQEGQTGSMKC